MCQTVVAAFVPLTAGKEIEELKNPSNIAVACSIRSAEPKRSGCPPVLKFEKRPGEALEAQIWLQIVWLSG